MKSTDRVLDRKRIIGKVKLSDGDISEPVVLKMGGRVLTIFLLWMVAIFVSTAGFACEHSSYNYRRICDLKKRENVNRNLQHIYFTRWQDLLKI